MDTDRRIVWFSCGAASAVAAKITCDTYDNVEVVYCNLLADEHPDNRRFLKDVERWIGQPVTIIQSAKYQSVDDVFAKRRYMAGPKGAPCTAEMKKVPRFAFQQPDDIHIFGLTADEQKRITRFEAQNPEAVEWVLADRSLTKDDCLEIIKGAGIALPVLYLLGYSNNNCLGCVKASGANYWNTIRRDFPDVFQKRVEQSREYGARLTKVPPSLAPEGTPIGKDGRCRVFLDELPADYLPADPYEDLSCGVDCDGGQLSWLAEAALVVPIKEG